MSHSGEVRVLTLTQPWATLIACGAKTIETRSWLPPKALAGGFTILVHASKQIDGDACLEPAINDALDVDGSLVDLPRGAVVAIGVVDWACREGDVDCAIARLDGAFDGQEPFGQFGPGRCYWHLTDVERLANPVPARGYQGLWRPDDDLLTAVRAQMRAFR